MPTVQILLRNNRKTIERALASVSGLGRIVVGDLGSDDGSAELCSSHGAEIINFRGCADFSSARNRLSDEGLNFYLEAWEFLARGAGEVVAASGPRQVYVIQNGMVSKETRIWKGRGFKNPAYEAVADSSAECDPRIAVVSDVPLDLRAERRAIVEKWLDNRPTSPEPYYYMACCCLSERKYDDFMSHARKYLAMEMNQGVEAVLLRYYMAQIELHTGSLQDASGHILLCIERCPTMAEFWCVLGDMFYKQNKFGKARFMYDNAIIMGKRRKSTDSYPVEISKYREYPEKMIRSIDEISEDIIIRMQKTPHGEQLLSELDFKKDT
jgi:tetratricopeptide (TPR) repeat protein